MAEPSLVLADEPTGNLDSKASDEWGRAVVRVTHDPRIAAYADRIVFLKDGAIVDETRLDPGGQNVGNAGLVADKMKTMN